MSLRFGPGPFGLTVLLASFVADKARAQTDYEATARLTWPMGDHGLRKRLHRIRARTRALVLPPIRQKQTRSNLR